MTKDISFIDVDPDPEGTKTLLRRAAGGDRTALNAAFLRALPQLEKWIAAKMGSRLRQRMDISDVVQVTLLEAYEDLDSFQPGDPGSFFAWLRKIAIHRLVDADRHLRALKRDIEREKLLDEFIELSVTSPLSHLARGEDQELMLEALASLPQKHRDVIRLARLEGRSYAECAELLGITERAFSLRLVRALVAIRTALSDSSRDTLWHV